MRKKLFKNIIPSLTIFTILFGGLVGCGSPTKSFNINSSSDIYEFDIDDYIDLNVENLVGINDTSKLVFSFEKDSANSSISLIEGQYVYSASKEGEAIIYGKIGKVRSSNTITINSVPSSEYVEPSMIKANIENVFNASGGLVFGEIYDVGIGKKDVHKYRIEGSEGLVIFNEDGCLEVIGFGYPEGNEKIKIFYNDEVIFNDYLNIYASILCKEIRLDLFNKGIIDSLQANVTPDLLSHVTRLDLDGKIVNDSSSRLGIKYLTNLNYLDLSNNNIDDLAFVSSLRKLKEIHLANNMISDIDYIVDNQNLEVLDLSNNNVSDLKKIQHLHKIKELNLSYNNIKDISAISSVYSLESLDLNHNSLTVYKEPLSNLDALKKLYIGYCGISFNEITSLSYLHKLEKLDVSDTGASLETISKLSKLTTLIAEKCDFASQDITKLNNLTNLIELRLGYNNFDIANFQNKLDGTKLSSLEVLGLGGNDFSDIPNLASFERLKELDLSNSYNLTSISNLNSLQINSLNIDASNSIGDFSITTINSLKNLKRLSMKEAFNYLTETQYNALIEKVNSSNFELRLLGEKFVNKDTIYNYNRSIYFSLDDFINNFENIDNHYQIKALKTGDDYVREYIVSVVNDGASSNNAMFDIDRSVFRIDFYGDQYKTYHYLFDIKDRKQSKFTIGLSNMNIVGENHAFDVENPIIIKTVNEPSDHDERQNHQGKTNFIESGETIIKAAPGSKLEVVSISGTNKLIGGEGIVKRLSRDNYLDHSMSLPGYAINCYDLSIASNQGSNNSLTIQGGSGGEGADGWKEPTWCGTIGCDGADAIYCNNITIRNGLIKIQGGNGGNGGVSHGSTVGFFDVDPWDGQNGGNGGHAINYGGVLVIENATTVSLFGGSGGLGGKAEVGSTGHNGLDGQKSYKH